MTNLCVSTPTALNKGAKWNIFYKLYGVVRERDYGRERDG
jgi:hypothetical protein